MNELIELGSIRNGIGDSRIDEDTNFQDKVARGLRLVNDPAEVERELDQMNLTAQERNVRQNRFVALRRVWEKHQASLEIATATALAMHGDPQNKSIVLDTFAKYAEHYPREVAQAVSGMLQYAKGRGLRGIGDYGFSLDTPAPTEPSYFSFDAPTPTSPITSTTAPSSSSTSSGTGFADILGGISKLLPTVFSAAKSFVSSPQTAQTSAAAISYAAGASGLGVGPIDPRLASAAAGVLPSGMMADSLNAWNNMFKATNSSYSEVQGSMGGTTVWWVLGGVLLATAGTIAYFSLKS